VASSEVSGLMPVALLEILSAGPRRWKKEVQKKQPEKRESRNKRKVETRTHPEATGISRFW
jgi:hypothetical protein